MFISCPDETDRRFKAFSKLLDLKDLKSGEIVLNRAESTTLLAAVHIGRFMRLTALLFNSFVLDGCLTVFSVVFSCA